MEVSDIIFYGNAYIWEPDGYMPTGEGTEGRTGFFFFFDYANAREKLLVC